MIDYNVSKVSKAMIKPKESLLQPDERFQNMVGSFDLLGNLHPCGIEDLYELVRELELGPAVPDEIRQQFDIARHAFIYSWFAYDLVTLAENHSYGVVEAALGLKAEQEGARPRRGLQRRLDDAVKLGWLNSADFAMSSWNGRTISMLDFLPKLRNSLAHGKSYLLPSGTLDMMRLCAAIITKLFPETPAYVDGGIKREHFWRR